MAEAGKSKIALIAAILCITLIIMYALYLGKDGVAVTAGIAAIVGLVTGSAGYVLGKARHIKDHPRDK